jgi:hypothetical protein
MHNQSKVRPRGMTVLLIDLLKLLEESPWLVRQLSSCASSWAWLRPFVASVGVEVARYAAPDRTLHVGKGNSVYRREILGLDNHLSVYFQNHSLIPSKVAPFPLFSFCVLTCICSQV